MVLYCPYCRAKELARYIISARRQRRGITVPPFGPSPKGYEPIPIKLKVIIFKCGFACHIDITADDVMIQRRLNEYAVRHPFSTRMKRGLELPPPVEEGVGRADCCECLGIATKVLLFDRNGIWSRCTNCGFTEWEWTWGDNPEYLEYLSSLYGVPKKEIVMKLTKLRPL